MITLVATCQVGLVHYTSRCGCCVGGLMYEAGVEKRGEESMFAHLPALRL